MFLGSVVKRTPMQCAYTLPFICGFGTSPAEGRYSRDARASLRMGGGVNLKKLFGAQALSIFIMPPSVEVLRERLAVRGTDSAEAIEKRVAKAEEEMRYAPQFDLVIVNDDLPKAIAEVETAIREFIS